MKKLVVTGPNTADFITTEIPSINTNQILVKTICTAISTGTEIRVYKGISIDADNKFMFPNMHWSYPVENGYSTVGEIVEIGKDVLGYNKQIKSKEVFVLDVLCREGESLLTPTPKRETRRNSRWRLPSRQDSSPRSLRHVYTS